ncbi:Kelch repeat-containing protein [Flagellimonas sp. S174]|uniref:Kelch repeat-containing protein n=1 Tax=Flagellimonas sp. S174 TaxID=3410790 RepID=UPI003BF545F4
MKMRISNLVLILMMLGFFSCSDDNKDTGDSEPEEVTLTFNVETNEDQMGVFSHHKMAIFNGEVWSVGGYNSYHTSIHNDVWKSADGRAWASHASEQFPKRRDHSLTVFDNKMWVIGGFTESSPDTFTALSDVLYSSDGSTWTLATDNPIDGASIGSHATVVFNNKLYIIKDGSNEDASGCTVWSSSDGVNWTRKTNNAFSYREGFSMAVFNNEIYVFGGFHESTYFNEIWKSDDGIDWTRVNTIGGAFPSRAYGETVVYNNKLWVFGGTNGTTSTGLGLHYSNDGIQWERYLPLPSEDGLQHFSALCYDDAIWVFGGMQQEEGSDLTTRVGTINTIKQD